MGNTSIYQKLSAVQQSFAAPKDNYNAFGGYAYRNFETMLDNLKPILAAHNLVLTTTNRLAECGGHVYVQSTCILTDTETGESVSSDSYAREDDSRKGMSAAQITGGCVSYSAKYALGLLLSVGTGQRDADSMDNRPQTQNSRPAQPQTRPTPPPQQPMQTPQYQPPVQQAPAPQYQAPPMQYHAPAPQYTAPPMPPQQTAPLMQYQAPPMPPQQPMTAPPVQQAQPMAQQPMQTAQPQPPVQAQLQPQFSADGVKPQAGISADAQKPADATKQTPPFTRKERPAQPQIAADAPNFSRPPRPAEDSIPVQPQLRPSAIPASWGINEACAPDELLPLDANGEPIMENSTNMSGWMSIPEGVVEEELPFA